MAKTTPALYLAAKVTKLAAITNALGGAAFARVGRMADIDLERIRRIPAFPACVLCNLDGELEDANNEIWNMQLSVSILVQSAYDPFMDAACKQLDELVELVIDELQADRTDSGIICTFRSADASISDDDVGDVGLVMKSLVFAYTIDRTV